VAPGHQPHQCDGQLFVLTINHRFALSRPTLLGALIKKSFSSVTSPIFTCGMVRSVVGAASERVASESNSPAAPSDSRTFQSVIWFGVNVELVHQSG
jgi:hypothetical protein